jgi:hypothetical protein
MTDKKPKYLATSTPEVDFALVLARVIDAVNQDPAELRNAIYELARIKLKREGWRHDPPTDIGQMRRLTKALEIAIEGVEKHHLLKRDEMRAVRSLDRMIKEQEGTERALPADSTVLLIENGTVDAQAQRYYSSSSGELVAPAEHGAPQYDDGALEDAGRPRVVATDDGLAPETVRLSTSNKEVSLSQKAVPLWRRITDAVATRRPRVKTSPLARTVAVMIVALVTMLATTQRVAWFHPAAELVAAAVPVPKSTPVGMPPAATEVATAPPPQREAPRQLLPDAYGIYAVSNNELFELDALPGRAMDPRIAVSSVMTRKSHSFVPNGHVWFLAYKRTFASKAPDRVSVRVIARIRNAAGFNQQKTADREVVEGEWAMRNISFDLKVAPVPSNPEMIAMRLDNDRVLPSGRYGLVLDNVVYDFVVAGEVTEPAQCLERFIATNGTFYTECRKP